MRISLVTPAGARSRNGNRTTAERWSRFLRQLGHGIVVEEAWGEERSDLMIALHARRGHSSIGRYDAALPDHPLVVALTGTDLYRDIRFDASALDSLELATRLVVLQEAGLAELSPQHRAKARVIYQSAERIQPHPPAKTCFDVCVIGHLRAEKDPFRTALAARLLPDASRVRVTHVGKARGEEFAEQAHTENNQRYRWLGELPRLLAQSSIMEGGANAVFEALTAGVPVIASDVPGNVGVLGEDYPGYYPAGDEEALARLLERAEAGAGFYALLEKSCAARGHLIMPERERDALRGLVEEVSRYPGAG